MSDDNVTEQADDECCCDCHDEPEQAPAPPNRLGQAVGFVLAVVAFSFMVLGIVVAISEFGEFRFTCDYSCESRGLERSYVSTHDLCVCEEPERYPTPPKCGESTDYKGRCTP